VERAGQLREYIVPSEVNTVLGVKMINLFPAGRPFARDVLPDSAAERAGVLVGDRFLSVDGVPVASAHELRELIGKRTDQTTDIRVMRQGKPVTLQVTPDYNPQEKVGRIGVLLDDELEYEIVRPGPTPQKQFRDIFQLMGDTVYALIHSKETGVGARSLSGPVGIMGGWWHEIKNGGILRGVWFAVLLNINLAIINLLPLPVLDGGHITFATIEAIFRRPLNARFIQAASTAFAVLLISFMLYVTVFDVKRFFGFRFGSSKTPAQTNEVVPATQP
jgi:regulator of sigma E protease